MLRKFLGFIVVLFFVGCSENVFSPDVSKTLSLKSSNGDLKYSNTNIASFEKTFIDKDGDSYKNIDGVSTLLNTPFGLLTLKSKKNLIIYDKNSKVIFNKVFDHEVISANLKENILAVLLGNNSIKLFDITKKFELMSKKYSASISILMKSANPIFLGSIVVFPTLDGRIIFVDTIDSEIKRELQISREDIFNNVIHLEAIGESLLASTKYKMLLITPTNIFAYEENIKKIFLNKNDIYLLTRDGRVLLLDKELKEIKEVSFEFARFVDAVFSNDKIYILEKQGYVIELDSTLNTKNIYSSFGKIDSYVFATDDKFFYEDDYVKLP